VKRWATVAAIVADRPILPMVWGCNGSNADPTQAGAEREMGYVTSSATLSFGFQKSPVFKREKVFYS
jgi:hypothetical protein